MKVHVIFIALSLVVLTEARVIGKPGQTSDTALKEFGGELKPSNGSNQVGKDFHKVVTIDLTGTDNGIDPVGNAKSFSKMFGNMLKIVGSGLSPTDNATDLVDKDLYSNVKIDLTGTGNEFNPFLNTRGFGKILGNTLKAVGDGLNTPVNIATQLTSDLSEAAKSGVNNPKFGIGSLVKAGTVDKIFENVMKTVGEGINISVDMSEQIAKGLNKAANMSLLNPRKDKDTIVNVENFNKLFKKMLKSIGEGMNTSLDLTNRITNDFFDVAEKGLNSTEEGVNVIIDGRNLTKFVKKIFNKAGDGLNTSVDVSIQVANDLHDVVKLGVNQTQAGIDFLVEAGNLSRIFGDNVVQDGKEIFNRVNEFGIKTGDTTIDFLKDVGKKVKDTVTEVGARLWNLFW